MAELTPLDEKLGEVLGLARAAQVATEKVRTLEGADAFMDELDRMHEEATETERRTDELVDAREGRKTAIREKAGDTKSEGAGMMKIYLGGEEEALDGFEFLSMAEAGELCHWEIVVRMSELAQEPDVHELAKWAIEVQRGTSKRSGTPRSHSPQRRPAHPPRPKRRPGFIAGRRTPYRGRDGMPRRPEGGRRARRPTNSPRR